MKENVWQNYFASQDLSVYYNAIIAFASFHAKWDYGFRDWTVGSSGKSTLLREPSTEWATWAQVALQERSFITRSHNYPPRTSTVGETSQEIGMVFQQLIHLATIMK